MTFLFVSGDQEMAGGEILRAGGKLKNLVEGSITSTVIKRPT